MRPAQLRGALLSIGRALRHPVYGKTGLQHGLPRQSVLILKTHAEHREHVEGLRVRGLLGEALDAECDYGNALHVSLMEEYPRAYVEGYLCAHQEIKAGTANHNTAKARGLYPGSQDNREDWDRGYDACVCAYRLGHDIDAMVAVAFYADTYSTMAYVVDGLLDGTWDYACGKPSDPRVRPASWQCPSCKVHNTGPHYANAKECGHCGEPRPQNNKE